MPSAFPELELKDCFGGEVPEQIIHLEELCELPCDLDEVPRIPLDPDQRDVQFPPILPPFDAIRMRRNTCNPISPPGDVPYTVGPTNLDDAVSDIDPMVDEWERDHNPSAPVFSTEVVMTRIAFDHIANSIVVFFRTKEYDSCGDLIRISPETAQSFADTEPCSDG